jgi:hypothetical protein
VSLAAASLPVCLADRLLRLVLELDPARTCPAMRCTSRKLLAVQIASSSCHLAAVHAAFQCPLHSRPHLPASLPACLARLCMLAGWTHRLALRRTLW